MDITGKYYIVTDENPSVNASKLNAEEWLRIIRKIYTLCGKFLDGAYGSNKEYSGDKKSLGQYIFDFLLPESLHERRMPHKELQRRAECLPFLFPFDGMCVQAHKIMESKGRGNYSERWVVLSLDGKYFLVDTSVEIQSREKKDPHGYDEIVTGVSFCFDIGEHRQEFFKRLSPYLDQELARKIIYFWLDILEFEKMRRERDQEEFEKAFGFRQMVLARLNFPSVTT